MAEAITCNESDELCKITDGHRVRTPGRPRPPPSPNSVAETCPHNYAEASPNSVAANNTPLVFDQGSAIGNHRVRDGVPVAAKISGHLGYGPAEPANLARCPASCPIGQRLLRQRLSARLPR
jgi:hypothetical protein